MALIADLQKAKPSAAKGQYLKRVTVSSTMGPGVVVDKRKFEQLILFLRSGVLHRSSKTAGEER